jgi:hypothetical protein
MRRIILAVATIASLLSAAMGSADPVSFRYESTTRDLGGNTVPVVVDFTFDLSLIHI